MSSAPAVTLKSEAAPDETGNAAPEGCEQAVAPVDDANVLTTVDGGDNLSGDILGLEHHRIMEIAIEQGGIHEARSDIGKMDVEPPGIGLLLQSLQIDVLHGLGGRVRRSRSEALGAGNGGDGSDMSPTPFCEIAVGLANHPRKAQAVGGDGREFDVLMQLAVLAADARGVEEEVHASQPVDQAAQPAGGIVGRDVDPFYFRSAQALQKFHPTGCHTKGPSLLKQQARHLHTDA